MVINGRKIAEGIIAELKKRPAPKKFLGAVLVQGDPASASFVAQKEKTARILGIDFRIAGCLPDASERELVDAIRAFADDGACGGIVLQLPLPARIDRDAIIAVIPFEKDVDNLRSGDLVLSPAAGVVGELMKNLKLEIKNYRIAVVGTGFLVGQPIAKWLKGKVKELITLDIGDDLGKIKSADVVVLGTGKAGLVNSVQLKNDALIVDFGYSRSADGVLRGDFDSQGSGDITYTPTPGGTGPILVAKLFENFYQLNER